MDVQVHKFPTMEDGLEAVETLYCYVLNLYRSGERLDEETLDWFDAANTWLITS